MLNPILSSSNTFLSVTNYAGYTGTGADGQALSVKELSGIPLTTATGGATGQICVPVSIVGGGGTSSATFTSTIIEGTGPGSVPAGVLGYSITVLDGPVTVEGVSLLTGASVGDGGYPGFRTANAISFDATGGSALVVYAVPV